MYVFEYMYIRYIIYIYTNVNYYKGTLNAVRMIVVSDVVLLTPFHCNNGSISCFSVSRRHRNIADYICDVRIDTFADFICFRANRVRPDFIFTSENTIVGHVNV